MIGGVPVVQQAVFTDLRTKRPYHIRRKRLQICEDSYLVRWFPVCLIPPSGDFCEKIAEIGLKPVFINSLPGVEYERRIRFGLAIGPRISEAKYDQDVIWRRWALC